MSYLLRPHSALRFILWTLCAAMLPTATASPQSSANFGHQAWTTENGLPQSSVHQIFQSHDGHIWIATEGGAARFNGTEFKVFNHETNDAFTTDDISCFAEDTHDALWIGTSDGLLRYAAGRFRRYTAADGLPSPDIASLAASDDGSLYILTANGAARFDGKVFSLLQFSPSAMASGSGNTVFFASTSGVVEYEHGLTHPRKDLAMPNEPVQGIGTLPGHGLWFRTRSSVTLLKDGSERRFQTGRDLPATRIESFLADAQGGLWIGTNRGLFVLNEGDSRPQFQPAVGSGTVLSLLQDREGNLWVGTETAGLHILRRQKFRSLPELGDHVVTAITQAADGAMWIGTNGDGLDRWQFGHIKHFSTHNGLISEVILSLAADAHGAVWVGTPDGLNRIEREKVSSLTSAEGLPDDFIRSLYSDNDGSLWIGTRRGLAHLQGTSVNTFTRANGLNSDLIGAIVRSSTGASGDLWIGTLDGLSRLHDGVITTYSTKNGLSGNIITSLFEDSHNTLWIGTRGDGLNYGTGERFVSFHNFEVPATIDSILEDNSGYIWLGSNRGIRRVSRSELTGCDSSPDCSLHVNSFGFADGMPTDEISAIGHPAAWKTTDGLMWFATRKGVAIADPNHLSENVIPPPVVIERFTVDESEVSPLIGEPKISPGHSRFIFEYAGLSYVAPSKVRYRYILEGFDKQWTQAGSRRIAYYTNLPPRHYRFRVQAANNDGVWNEIGASFTFYVEPPFYRRLWFVVLSVILIAALGILLYRLRVRRLRSQFDAVLAERNRMAREIHDTLAQSFVGVSVQLELASQLLAQSQIPTAQQQLDRTRAYVREGLAEARRSIWDLRAITAENTLPTRLAHLIEKSQSEPMTIKLNIGGTYRPLPANLEDEVLRIAQEALTNVIRHARANNVSLNLRYQPDRLLLTVSDDGRGFQVSEQSLSAQGHFGLQGMRERTAQIHAQLTIESSEGKGTTIRLDVPILAEKGIKKNV